MSWISPEQAHAYLERWRRLRDIAAIELRAASMETRIRQLSTLVGSAHLFNPDPDRARGEAEVRARWARIRKASNV